MPVREPPFGSSERGSTSGRAIPERTTATNIYKHTKPYGRQITKIRKQEGQPKAGGEEFRDSKEATSCRSEVEPKKVSHTLSG
jgi:hypothetical protein